MSSSMAGTCEVDVFEGFGECNQPGDTLLKDEGDEILVCTWHYIELARHGRAGSVPPS